MFHPYTAHGSATTKLLEDIMSKPTPKAQAATQADDRRVIKVPDTLPRIDLPGGRSVALGHSLPPAPRDHLALRFRRPAGTVSPDNPNFIETQIQVSPDALQAVVDLAYWYGIEARKGTLAIEFEIHVPESIAKIVGHLPPEALGQEVAKAVGPRVPVKGKNK